MGMIRYSPWSIDLVRSAGSIVASKEGMGMGGTLRNRDIS